MSYDLDLYTAKAPGLTAPDAGDSALFHVDPPARCEDEDIAPDYLDLLGKRRRWLTRLHIEGRPDAQALAAFEAWLAETIALTDGILIDEQAGRIQSRTSKAPLPDADRKTEPRLGRMSFFFEDVETFHATGLARVLDIVARVLPEAMPTRFGRWEPLQGQVKDGDVTPLLAEFATDPELFLKAKAPFAHIYMSVACEAELAKWHPTHVIRSRYLAGTLAFELRPKALEDRRLVTLMREIAVATGAFYAEIRDDDCPVSAWFWHGLPAGPVRAFVLGRPYTDLWPEAVERGVEIAPGTILVAPTRFDPDLPEPPDDLKDPGAERQTKGGPQQTYAKVFPFEVPGRR